MQQEANNSQADENDATNTKEMSFWDHLGELRKRIVYSLVGVIIGSILSGVFIDFIMDKILLKPAFDAHLPLQNLQPFGQPFLYFKTILVCGLIISTPFILYQIWRFVSPGLYDNERKWAGKITFFTSLCFFAGVGFSYYVMVPSMLGFANKFGSTTIQNIIDINAYFGFFIMILLASGIMFEMPMAIFVLTKFGIVNVSFLRKYRRHSIVVILILAAVLTPTPDPITQSIFAAPLLILYEISILIAKYAEKGNIRTRDDKDNK